MKVVVSVFTQNRCKLWEECKEILFFCDIINICENLFFLKVIPLHGAKTSLKQLHSSISLPEIEA